MDKEKVINELIEHIESALALDSDYADCVRTDLLQTVVGLLKEQESTTFKPHYIDKYSKHFICGVECGACHNEISSTYHYCPYCGRLLKWTEKQ